MKFSNSAVIGKKVKLVGWDEEPFEVVLRRPSLLGLASKGAIPNPLMSTAKGLFLKGMGTEGDLKAICGVMEIVAKEALVSPTWKELQEAGVELTDMQLIEILGYAQKGAQALSSFRNEPTNPIAD